ncbi:methyl-accepting chemotaxis protein [Azospirillum fermentarium]|uniref:methyl-accepting chemotaxis protein n=1 Tax=Azospirillum fermentarium TaxID=1233114 RepID=UPI002226B0CD|nr:methyl-accepting chemotaxis protein [Azospirillum fermentarium]MCW2246658.1 methyl-accepting chemotaxis protein [Azospirillum fermentarium]
MTFKVAHKLALGFGAVCLLTVALSVYQLYHFADALRLMRAIATQDILVTDLMRDIVQIQGELRYAREVAVTDAVIAQTSGAPSHTVEQNQEYLEASQRLRGQLQRLIDHTTDRRTSGLTEGRRNAWGETAEAVQELSRRFQSLRDRVTPLFQALNDGRLQDALRLRGEVDALRGQLDNQINAINDLIRKLGMAGNQELESIYDTALRSAALALAAMLITAVTIAVLIGQSISRRLGEAIGFIGRVGQGDLTQTATIRGNDELAQLGRHLNDMTVNLKAVAGTTRAAAENVHAATAQIRASTQQQAASVSEQLAAVEETTATLSEITESGAQISRRAQEVAHSAHAAASTGDSGIKAVADTNQAMDAIREQAEAVAENIVILSERTQAIGEIIITVSDIAERSHLLALNAAIEAAAAGEHGRTFAVVAGELKSLADQAKEATAQVRSNLSEIQHGINASVMLTEEAVKRVTAGKRQTDATQSTIRDLVDNIQDSVVAFQQIVAGTNQQQIGLEQVIQALQNIRQASSQTAAGTRQLEGAATNLNTLGQTLVEAVRNYRV